MYTLHGVGCNDGSPIRISRSTIFDRVEIGPTLVNPGTKKNAQFFYLVGKEERLGMSHVKPITVKNVHKMRCDICIYVDRSYIECARCRYATACSESYSNHMSVMHARRSSSVSMATKSVVGMRLRSTLRQDALSCDCGYFSQFGSIIGVCTNH